MKLWIRGVLCRVQNGVSRLPLLLMPLLLLHMLSVHAHANPQPTPSSPLRIHVFAALSSDADMLLRLKSRIQQHPDLEMVEDKARAHVQLALLRPRAGAPAASGALPDSSQESPPWLWVLDTEGKLFGAQEKLRAPATVQGAETTVHNLRHLGRMWPLLHPAPTTPSALSTSLVVYKPLNRAEEMTQENMKGAILLEGGLWMEERRVPFDFTTLLEQGGSRAVLVEAVNNSDKQQYIYALNITEDGKITPFLPQGNSANANTLAPGEKKLFSDFSMICTESREFIHILHDTTALDYAAYAHDGFAMPDMLMQNQQGL